MPDATECWLVEYVDLDKRTVFDRFANVNEAIPCLHKVLASGQRPRLYRETPITLKIDVGGEAPVKAPRKRRKTPPPADKPDPAPPLTGPGNGAAGEPKDCEARFDVDPACPCPAEFDPVTRGWFCPLHLNAIGLAGRLELHRKHASRNRPVRVAHAG